MTDIRYSKTADEVSLINEGTATTYQTEVGCFNEIFHLLIIRKAIEKSAFI